MAFNLTFDNGGAPLEDIALITGGKLLLSAPRNARGVSTDSRKLMRDDIFIALHGDNFDGNDYVGAAIEAGAAAAVCERIPDGVCGNIILVEDTLNALRAIARAYRRSLESRNLLYTAAVTGSVGKTTTRQLIYAVLSEKYKTHKTLNNFNNQIGVPQSVLAMPVDCEAAVFELGMSARGEIAALSAVVEPDIAVITSVGTSHIELLGSRENIRDAKLEIREGLKPNGALILNGDEPLLDGIKGAVYVSSRNKNADYFYTPGSETGGGIHFDITHNGITSRELFVPSPGIHIAADAALAYAVGDIAGLSEEQIRIGLTRFVNTGMRQRIEKRGDYNIIADCYNACPESMKAALTVLAGSAAVNGGRAIAVLGDMRELGEFSEKLHYEVGEAVSETGADMLFTFGPYSAAIASGARDAGMDTGDIFENKSLDKPEITADAIRNELRPGDTVLFKASRGTEIERIMSLLFGM